MTGILPGQRVRSDFVVIDGTPLEPSFFTSPFIGIAASFTAYSAGPSPEIVRFWRALQTPDEAIWYPGKAMPGTWSLLLMANLAISRYYAAGMLTPGVPHEIWGDVVSFDGVIRDAEGTGERPDDASHIDFVPPEVPCAALFASNHGGTRAWRGEFTYVDNLQASYPTDAMEQVTVRPGEFFFTKDVRTFMHGRAPSVDNTGRMLVRMFLGVPPEHYAK